MDYIAMMTERANRLSQWVVEETTVHKLNSKQRRMIIRKFIEIAKVNNKKTNRNYITNQFFLVMFKLEQFSYMYGTYDGSNTATRI